MSIESFYRTSKQKFIRKILPIVKDQDLAEDLLHDSLIKALERESTYDARRASEETWFKCILFSTVWDWKRSQKKQLDIVETDLESLLDEALIPSLEARGDVNLKEFKNVTHKKVFYLRYVLGYTVQEISSLLDLTEDNVRKILQRLRKRC